MTPTTRAQVAVLGLGPAGRATAHRLAVAGVDVVAVDLAPDRRWTPTYAAWADELPGWLPADVRRTQTPRPRAWAITERVVPRTYVVLDTSGLQDTLALDRVRVIPGSVTAAEEQLVTLTDGSRLRADVVLDARGTRPHPSRAQQTAVGVVVTTRQAGPIGGTWFMDWRQDNGTRLGDVPSFLYAVPLDDEHVLLEETCLVGRPALGLDELLRRLRVRLAARGVPLTGDERVERVRFCVESGERHDHGRDDHGRAGRRRGPVRIGARGGLMHPATGYSVAVSLSIADRLVDAVVAGRSVSRALWPVRARETDRLRAMGLTTLLRLPPEGVEQFFAAFFALPVSLQRAYLSDRDRPLATLAAMASMVQTLPAGLTGVAIGSAFGS
ncbi:MAG: lycopene cyclase family protein [Propionibacteriaceae bacterium]